MSYSMYLNKFKKFASISFIALVISNPAWADKACDKALAGWQKAETKEDKTGTASETADKALQKAISDQDEKAAKKASKKSIKARKAYLKAIEALNKSRDKVKASCRAECRDAMQETTDLMPDVISAGRQLALLDGVKNKNTDDWRDNWAKYREIQSDNNDKLEELQKKADKLCRAK